MRNGYPAPSSLQSSTFPPCPFSPWQLPLSPCLLRQPVDAVFCSLVPPSGRWLPGPKLKPLAAQSQSLGSHEGFNFSKCKNWPFIKLKASVSGYSSALCLLGANSFPGSPSSGTPESSQELIPLMSGSVRHPLQDYNGGDFLISRFLTGVLELELDQSKRLQELGEFLPMEECGAKKPFRECSLRSLT